MDVRWLRSFFAVKEETETSYAKYSRHYLEIVIVFTNSIKFPPYFSAQ